MEDGGQAGRIDEAKKAEEKIPDIEEALAKR
jgi:hypothetical protein